MDLVFRDMTTISETKVKKRVKDVTAKRDGSAGPSNSVGIFESISSAAEQHTPLFPDPEPRISPLSTNWREVAVPRFFSDYIFESPLFSNCGMTFLPQLCGRMDLHAPLKEALNAVAWLSLSNQLGIEWLKAEAYASYFQAVELMAKLLHDPDEAHDDATLATNYLFGIFEVTVLCPFPQTFTDIRYQTEYVFFILLL